MWDHLGKERVKERERTLSYGTSSLRVKIKTEEAAKKANKVGKRAGNRGVNLRIEKDPLDWTAGKAISKNGE